MPSVRKKQKQKMYIVEVNRQNFPQSRLISKTIVRENNMFDLKN